MESDHSLTPWFGMEDGCVNRTLGGGFGTRNGALRRGGCWAVGLGIPGV